MARKPLDQLSPKYRARIERAQARGKTRQEARGHKAREHVVRKERERKIYGIASSENDRVRRWYRRTFNPNGNKGKPTEDQVIEEVKSRGYGWFQWYRHTWGELRQTYKRELKRGAYASRGSDIFKQAVASSHGGSGGGSGGGSSGRDHPSRPYEGGGDDGDYYGEDYGMDYDDDYDVPDQTWLFYH